MRMKYEHREGDQDQDEADFLDLLARIIHPSSSFLPCLDFYSEPVKVLVHQARQPSVYMPLCSSLLPILICKQIFLAPASASQRELDCCPEGNVNESSLVKTRVMGPCVKVKLVPAQLPITNATMAPAEAVTTGGRDVSMPRKRAAAQGTGIAVSLGLRPGRNVHA